MLILGNGRMITRDADNPYLECGAVVIDGTKIVKAGTLSEVKAAYPDAEFLDAKGKVIMPAFINAHEVHSQEDCPSKDMTQKDFWIFWMGCGGRLTGI